MATFRYATKDLSISNAIAFYDKLVNAVDTSTSKESNILYACIGRTKPWPDEPTPITPPDNEQYLHFDIHREMIGGKKINPTDVSHVAVRYDWISGTVYEMYRDTTDDLYETNFYVFTDEYNVYKCLSNNGGSPSTVKPTGFATQEFSTSDGYTWKYMYTVSLGEANKFLTTSHIPVKRIVNGDGSSESDRQLAVQQAAVNGAINIIETKTPGSGYNYLANGQVEIGGKYALRLSTTGSSNPSTIPKLYVGDSVYISSGTGSGQLRRIVGYYGSNTTLVVNTAFTTTPNTDSTVIISPTITVIGDGIGALAYSRVNASGGVANVAVIQSGNSYTRAVVSVSANSVHGAGATATPIISPAGGHGSNPIRELHADKLMLNVQFQGSEGVSANGNGYIPSNTEFRTISVLKNPTLKVDANNNTITSEAIANTSNSPSTIRLTDRLTISYESVVDGLPQKPLVPNETLTNKREYIRAQQGRIPFITELSPTARSRDAIEYAVQSANADVVYTRKDETLSDQSFYTLYINNVETYGTARAFVPDDVILRRTDEGTELATVEFIKGPEANTFSGEVIFTENIEAVTRSPGQVEDIKIILDF
jgi:hypothetical protein